MKIRLQDRFILFIGLFSAVILLTGCGGGGGSSNGGGSSLPPSGGPTPCPIGYSGSPPNCLAGTVSSPQITLSATNTSSVTLPPINGYTISVTLPTGSGSLTVSASISGNPSLPNSQGAPLFYLSFNGQGSLNGGPDISLTGNLASTGGGYIAQYVAPAWINLAYCSLPTQNACNLQIPAPTGVGQEPSVALPLSFAVYQSAQQPEPTLWSVSGSVDALAYAPDGSAWALVQSTSGQTLDRVTTAGLSVVTSLPTTTTLTSSASLAVMPTGNIVVLEPDSTSVMIVTPSGAVTTPSVGAPIGGNAVIGGDGRAWFPELSPSTNLDAVSSGGVVSKYPSPLNQFSVALAKDGGVWAIPYESPDICHSDTSGNFSCVNTIAYPNIQTTDPFVDSNGNLWNVYDTASSTYGYVSPSLTPTLFPLPAVTSYLAFASVGNDVWANGGNLPGPGFVKIDPSAGIVQTVKMQWPSAIGDLGIGVDSRGRIYFVDILNDVLGEYDPSTGNIESFTLPTTAATGGLLSYIVLPSGVVWTAETTYPLSSAGYVARIVFP